ncbi:MULTISPECIES: excisionase family DNA-binding protein [unclassified Methylobacterium]|uniref:excisionase family DNA-binding protein n=1 Tax=unclassified Methylobacterium TaxID=2615210 RepID=UPI001FB9D20A|nr:MULTISPECIES: excisionase family DNA-binding protein [unclassified Methylobacterium]MCJ2092210.1 excisionase family DNA-binding protein [Methylobacterium sp. J-072]MCJ2125117.1 excisionase family DNA-binding protein [Methylobacterium sp. J-077]
MALQQMQAPQGDLRASTEKLCFTLMEACFSTGLGRSTIYQLVKDKKLRAIKAGNRTLIPADSLRSYLASLPSLETEAA